MIPVLGPALSPRHAHSTQLEPGAYLTDDTRLYCVLFVSDSAESRPVVTLEDCGTLELFVCPLRELEQRRLRTVREPTRTEVLD